MRELAAGLGAGLPDIEFHVFFESITMVRLSKIYTKTGDAGTTGLGDGQRVSKDDLRVEAYGTVDEANATIGVVVNIAVRSSPGSLQSRVADLLKGVQNAMFDVGADLCCPKAKGEKPGQKLRVTEGQTERLERHIDHFNDALSPLNSFVLPGGSELAAAMHVARTVTRRAERCCVSLLASKPEATNPEAVRYLNRLSDLLFVLGRVANENGQGDVLWAPGADQGGPPKKERVIEAKSNERSELKPETKPAMKPAIKLAMKPAMKPAIKPAMKRAGKSAM